MRAEATLAWASLHGLVSLLNAQRVDAAVDRESLVSLCTERTAAALLAASQRG